MAELTESKMNFAAVNRVDPYAKSLLETAAHVALYTFLDNEWERTDIEGALFIYSRTGEPFHNILIMNRLNMNNLVEPITQGMDLQLQDPFLLYKNSQGLIFGIWFYDKDECKRIARILTTIVTEASEGKTGEERVKPVAVQRNNVDLFSMLTRAQEEFNSKSPRRMHSIGQDMIQNRHDFNYNLKETDHTPQSVMDFFAKASNGAKYIQDPSVIQPPGMFMNNPRSGPPPGLARMPSVPIPIPPPQNDVRPLLQRLMSNPVHSVEHIEKQQQAITPQKDFAGIIRNGNSMLSTIGGSDTKNGLCFNVKLHSSPSANGSNTKVNANNFPQNEVENNLGFLRITDSSPPNGPVQSQQFFNSKLVQNHSPPMLLDPNPKLSHSHSPPMLLDSNINQIENHRPLSAPMENLMKPALMPPVMFTTSVKKEQESETTCLQSASTAALVNLNSGNGSFQVRPEPLTKNQLLLAVNYLLKNDPEFITKLHEAYVKSFTELVQ